MTTDLTASGSCGLNAIVFGGITAGTIAVVHWMKSAPPLERERYVTQEEELPKF